MNSGYGSNRCYLHKTADRATSQRPSHYCQWHAVARQDWRSLKRAARTLWPLADGCRSLLSLDQARCVGEDSGRGSERCRGRTMAHEVECIVVFALDERQ